MKQLLVIGASAGGIAAISTVLCGLGEGFPLPGVIVLHLLDDERTDVRRLFTMPPGLTLKVAADKAIPQPGEVHIAPPGYHVLIEQDGSLALSNDEPVHFLRPSIDVLFESAAAAWGAGVIALVLTGASQDGARGLTAIAARGRLRCRPGPG